jgi:hypothetical protein
MAASLVMYQQPQVLPKNSENTTSQNHIEDNQMRSKNSGVSLILIAQVITPPLLKKSRPRNLL